LRRRAGVVYAASSYLKIVDALRNVGRAADAERWARRGLGIGNPIDQGKLRDTYVNLLLERGATDEASAMRWQLFGRPQVNAWTRAPL
jgi:hypothetical protein